MELDGQSIKIYNHTSKVINDLYYTLPKYDITCKVKKCLPNAHIQEHIFNKYKGDLVFFFQNSPNHLFVFEDILGIPFEEGIFGYDIHHEFALQFAILEIEDKLVIQQQK